MPSSSVGSSGGVPVVMLSPTESPIMANDAVLTRPRVITRSVNALDGRPKAVRNDEEVTVRFPEAPASTTCCAHSATKPWASRFGSGATQALRTAPPSP